MAGLIKGGVGPAPKGHGVRNWVKVTVNITVPLNLRAVAPGTSQQDPTVKMCMEDPTKGGVEDCTKGGLRPAPQRSRGQH